MWINSHVHGTHADRENMLPLIAAKPARTVKLAAQELQAYVAKITGAKLAIVTDPTAGVPTQVCVGRSAHTDPLVRF